MSIRALPSSATQRTSNRLADKRKERDEQLVEVEENIPIEEPLKKKRKTKKTKKNSDKKDGEKESIPQQKEKEKESEVQIEEVVQPNNYSKWLLPPGYNTIITQAVSDKWIIMKDERLDLKQDETAPQLANNQFVEGITPEKAYQVYVATALSILKDCVNENFAQTVRQIENEGRKVNDRAVYNSVEINNMYIVHKILMRLALNRSKKNRSMKVLVEQWSKAKEIPMNAKRFNKIYQHMYPRTTSRMNELIDALNTVFGESVTPSTFRCIDEMVFAY
jgi:hypothetical protein